MWTLMVVVLITTTGCPVIIGTCLKLAQSFMDAKEGVIKADQKYLVVLWNVSIINTTYCLKWGVWKLCSEPYYYFWGHGVGMYYVCTNTVRFENL